MLEKLDIQWQVTKTKQISICLMILLIGRVIALTFVLRGLAMASSISNFSASYYATMLGFAFWGCLGISIVFAAMIGIHRKMLWGVICAAIAALMSLPTLLFPVSLFIAWYLLPDSVREEITQEIKPLFTKQI